MIVNRSVTCGRKPLGSSKAGCRELQSPDKARVTRLLVEDLEAVFLDYRIGEDFLGDFLDLFLGVVASPAIEIENKELALADVSDGHVAEAGKGVLNGLAL